MFPGGPNVWSRTSASTLRLGRMVGDGGTDLQVTVHERSDDEVELTWESGSVRLVRAPYRVGDAGVCP